MRGYMDSWTTLIRDVRGEVEGEKCNQHQEDMKLKLSGSGSGEIEWLEIVDLSP